MRNIMKIASLLLACLSLNTLPASAQKDVPQAPVVPMEVLVRGRQGVISHLCFQITQVSMEVTGSSVVTPPWFGQRWFDLEELSSMGYTHRGSSMELGEALASNEFRLDVIPINGYYDVNVIVTYYTTNGAVAMRGWGRLDIYRQPDGSLTVSEFTPSMYFDGPVAFQYSGCLGAAMWIPAEYGSSINLPMYWVDDSLWTVIVPGNALGNGYLAVADCNGEVTAWNMENGNQLSGEWIIARLGNVVSKDIHAIKRGPINIGDNMFYRQYGRIYGRPQLIELDTVGVTNAVSLDVPIWGSATKVSPAQVFITPIFINVRGGGRLEVGTEYQVPQIPPTPGSARMFWFQIEAGQYHIRTVYPGVQDFDSMGGGLGRTSTPTIGN